MQVSSIFLPCIDKGGYRKFGWYNQIKKTYHLGSDRKCDYLTNVFNFLSGKVIFSDEVEGFGSFGGNGGVVIVECVFKDEKYSILYGHITREAKYGDLIKGGQEIGKVIKYENYFTENGENKIYRADHLHWGVWKGGGIPSGRWGYSASFLNWINTDKFLIEVLDSL